MLEGLPEEIRRKIGESLPVPRAHRLAAVSLRVNVIPDFGLIFTVNVRINVAAPSIRLHHITHAAPQFLDEDDTARVGLSVSQSQHAIGFIQNILEDVVVPILGQVMRRKGFYPAQPSNVVTPDSPFHLMFVTTSRSCLNGQTCLATVSSIHTFQRDLRRECLDRSAMQAIGDATIDDVTCEFILMSRGGTLVHPNIHVLSKLEWIENRLATIFEFFWQARSMMSAASRFWSKAVPRPVVVIRESARLSLDLGVIVSVWPIDSVAITFTNFSRRDLNVWTKRERIR